MTRDALLEHAASGASGICRIWTISRADGVVLGFTDHDRDLMLDGVLCRAGSGMSAVALQQSSGLSVDNTEAVGLLSDGAVTEAELSAGRYDGAEVRIWSVAWADPSVRRELFRGSLGEVVRRGSEFRVELRGQAEALNQTMGHAYTRQCSAVLGDARCRFDLGQPGYADERVVEIIEEGRVLLFDWAHAFDDRWFEDGRLDVLTGAAAGLSGMIRADRQLGGVRRVELWQAIRAPVETGDRIRLTAGCDKRAGTCRLKFGNLLNFRGFPFLPGEDWLTAYPRRGGADTTSSAL
ncbi:DUF2163 domain-containing protein [Neotabrizicola sp. VNH66]|uniref:DUF2163 domain-containing protein n=1 Tax=Neotabrizicola sp. VNH66 TaxID=3400918 RepID=UPI003C04550D